MTKMQMEDLAKRTFNLLNGVINLNRIGYLEIVREGSFLFDQYLKEIDTFACRVEMPDNSTVLLFSSDLVMQFLTPIDELLHASYIVHIIAHELSHSNQRIDYMRYVHDDEYYRYIENCNNIYTYRFINNYIGWLKEKLGISALCAIWPDSLLSKKDKLAMVKIEETEYRMNNPICWEL